MFQIQTLFHDGNRDVGRYGDPYLRLDGVFRRAVKSLDSKMLFYPFKEQLHLLSVIGVMEPPVIVNIEPVMIEIMEPIGDRNYRASW